MSQLSTSDLDKDENGDLTEQLVTDATGEKPKSGASAVTLKNRSAGQQGRRNRWHPNRRGCWAEGDHPVRPGQGEHAECLAERLWRQDKAPLLTLKLHALGLPP